MTDEPKTPQETSTAGSECSAGLGRDLLPIWDAAFRAFSGAFDTPIARMRDDSAFAADARRRLRDFDELIRERINRAA